MGVFREAQGVEGASPVLEFHSIEGSGPLFGGKGKFRHGEQFGLRQQRVHFPGQSHQTQQISPVGGHRDVQDHVVEPQPRHGVCPLGGVFGKDQDAEVRGHERLAQFLRREHHAFGAQAVEVPNPQHGAVRQGRPRKGVGHPVSHSDIGGTGDTEGLPVVPGHPGYPKSFPGRMGLQSRHPGHHHPRKFFPRSLDGFHFASRHGEAIRQHLGALRKTHQFTQPVQ